MAALSEWVDRFESAERPTGGVLDSLVVMAQALRAARFLAAYAALAAHADEDPAPAITPDTEISVSEWALISPLFLLYLEREQAIYLEASRGMGLDVYGRASSEVAGDIAQAEANLPRLAFCQPVQTV